MNVTVKTNSNPNSTGKRPVKRNKNKSRVNEQNGRNISLPHQKKPVTFPELLSPCARDYLSVLENPWSGKVACVPTIPSIPSRKVRYWSKGIALTGTQSVGYVVFNPFNFTNNATTPNEVSVFYTDATFVDNFINTTAVGALGSQLNSEYDTSSIGGVKYRLVSAGLRVRYQGTELNRGGRCVMLEEPDHATLAGMGIPELSRYDAHRFFRPDQRWKSVVYHPADEDEFDYYAFGDRPLPYFLGCIFESPSSNVTSSFEFECSAIFELIGSAVRGLTPTPVDLVGLSAVQSFTNSPETRVPKEGDRSGWVNASLNVAGRLLWATASGMARAYFQAPVNARPLLTNDSSLLIEEMP